jgi:hypothetical protein
VACASDGAYCTQRRKVTTVIIDKFDMPERNILTSDEVAAYKMERARRNRKQNMASASAKRVKRNRVANRIAKASRKRNRS